MFKCLFVRRKLYDYVDDTLSEIDKIKVKNHLDICHRCNHNLSQIKSLIDMVAQKNPPQPDVEFWHNFKIDLDRKLNEKLVLPIRLKRRLSYQLRPAFAYVFALIFVLVMGNYLYKSPRSAPIRIAQDQDEDLVDEIEALDEAGDEAELDFHDDPYMEELNFLYQLDEI